MAALARSSRLLIETLGSSSRVVSRLGQTRNYAAPKKAAPAKQQSLGFRGKKRDIGKKNVRRDGKHPFAPMPITQLTDPVFKSNNRVELQLPLYSPEALMDTAVGQTMAFPMSENEAIRAYGLPKNLLTDFNVLSKPCSVVRDVTLTAVNTLDAASLKPSRDSRYIMTGPSGCGKSYLLLQAVEYAANNNWIVLYISRAINLVNSSTAYIYDEHTRTFVQPNYSHQLLNRFLNVNSAALRELVTQADIDFDAGTLPAGSLLTDLIKVGLQHKESASIVLSALMEEVSRQSTYPVLLAVDDVQALYCYTQYRDPHYRMIRPWHLSIPRMILEYASGKRSFARGTFLGAESTTQTEFNMPLELREALGLPALRPAGPYAKRTPELVEYAQGLKNFPVPAKLQVNEAASLFEVWMEDNALHSGEVRTGDGSELQCVPNDELFMSKYCEASGNARAFVWKGLMSTLSSL